MNDYRNLDTFAVVEPRILHIAQTLRRLLRLVELEANGVPVEVDGFRLRDLTQWIDYQATSALNAVIPISGLCNEKCVFCFEQGIPFPRECSLMSLDEAKTRLKYYTPQSGSCLFPSPRPHMEFFVHPRALEILRLARERDPNTVFWLTTNGTFLNEATVECLASLRPLMLKVSLNAADPELRKQLTGKNKGTETVMAAPHLLQQYGIPFIGSLVAWPTLSYSAIEDTIRYIDTHAAYAIRLRLPLVHKFFRDMPDTDFNSFWQEMSELGRRLRSNCRAPLIVEPPIYTMNPIFPEIDGVIPNSPAQLSGVHSGDLVRSINGKQVSTRTESERLLYHYHQENKAVDIVIERCGQDLHFNLGKPLEALATYPYDPYHFYKGESYGILHFEDFQLAYIQNVFAVIERYNANNVLLFTSPLVAPTFKTLVSSIPLFSEKLQHISLYLAVLEETTLGGNFDLVDSGFVADYSRAIRKWLTKGTQIDLILLPAAFRSPWGTDLTGGSYSELVLEFGIPVELIDWYYVYGRDV